MPRKQTTPEDLDGAIAAEELKQPFASIALPIQPPFPVMEARVAAHLPEAGEWQCEPKWDGFRGLAFRRGNDVLLQSKAGQPLGRYFPELIDHLLALPVEQFVLDGEIVILSEGHLDFNALLQRIHPAESRIRKLAKDTPVTFLCFDLLVNAAGELLTDQLLTERRKALEDFFKKISNSEGLWLSPATRDLNAAQRWMTDQADPAAGQPSARPSGLLYAMSWCVRCSTIIFPGDAFATAANSCAGGRRSRLGSARMSRCCKRRPEIWRWCLVRHE